jgi:site-specific DNA-methyltransferase (adenine-specific)
MGGGSTIAAAVAVGYDSVGIEIDPVFFKISQQAITRLAELEAEFVS